MGLLSGNYSGLARFSRYYLALKCGTAFFYADLCLRITVPESEAINAMSTLPSEVIADVLRPLSRAPAPSNPPGPGRFMLKAG